MNSKTFIKGLKVAAGVAVAAGGVLAAQYAGAQFLFRRTVTRRGADTGRTVDMAGTDWEQYKPYIRSCREWQDTRYREELWTTSRDGLRLHATYFPGCPWPAEGEDHPIPQGWEPPRPKRIVLAFHGYSSEGMKDYTSLSKFYLDRLGFAMVIVDERAHGKSEGDYIGFGVLDRFDVLSWISYINQRFGTDTELYLHGISMGGATVVMASGQELPANVKGIVSDCAFTSAWDVFSHVLKSWYHLPPFPMMGIAAFLSKRQAGYGLKDCDGAREVEKAKVPMLFIHGDQDTFVPCWMCEKIYAHCRAPKRKLIVSGASHAESYYKEREAYEQAILEFFSLEVPGKEEGL